jgi:hypothetical protein
VRSLPPLHRAVLVHLIAFLRKVADPINQPFNKACALSVSVSVSVADCVPLCR